MGLNSEDTGSRETEYKVEQGSLINFEAPSWDTGFNNLARIFGDGANML